MLSFVSVSVARNSLPAFSRSNPPPTWTNPSAGVSANSGARRFITWDIPAENGCRRSQICYTWTHASSHNLWTRPSFWEALCMSDAWSLRVKHNLFPPRSFSLVLVSIQFFLGELVFGLRGCGRRTVWISPSLQEAGRSGFFLAASSKKKACFSCSKWL